MNKSNLSIASWMMITFAFFLVAGFVVHVIEQEYSQKNNNQPIIKSLKIDYFEIRSGNNTIIIENFSSEYDVVSLNKFIADLDRESKVLP